MVTYMRKFIWKSLKASLYPRTKCANWTNLLMVWNKHPANGLQSWWKLFLHSILHSQSMIISSSFKGLTLILLSLSFMLTIFWSLAPILRLLTHSKLTFSPLLASKILALYTSSLAWRQVIVIKALSSLKTNLQKSWSLTVPIKISKSCSLLSHLSSSSLPLKVPYSVYPLSDPTVYRSLVGKLNFLTHTRPDLSYSVQTLSQFMQRPTDLHLAALKHTLSYVNTTTGQGIILQGSTKLNLQAFSNSDWASCVDTRKSITDYLIMLGISPISWKSKK